MRYTDEAQRGHHRFAWVPFGGGAHMCLGLHFAYMQAKCFARHFLQNLEVSLEPGYTAGLADVADPETARRIAGDAEAGVSPRTVIAGLDPAIHQRGQYLPSIEARATWREDALLPAHDGSITTSINVVSCAPSSATNTAISSAGSVLLALAETRWVAPGGSKKDWPTLKVSTGPPPSCERISPLVI